MGPVVTLPSSYHRANNHDDGPFRKVVGTHLHASTGYPVEDLECGHTGNVLSHAAWDTPAKKRRCRNCRTETA